MTGRGPLLITDFDGTMTERDFYRQALARLVPAETPDFWEAYKAGRMTHFEALNAIFARIRADEAAVIDAARDMALDPDAGEAVNALRGAGWGVAIVSAGCEWYIRRLLAEAGITAELHANPGVYDPAHGLCMTLPTTSPYFSPNTGIDKVAFVREALAQREVVAFAGDGPPDLPAALLVPPERRFARGWLAHRMDKDGTPYRPFTRWSEIAAMLLG